MKSIASGYLLFALAFVVVNIVGIVQCFHASIVLGVVSLFVQSSGVIQCIVSLFGYNIAEHLARALNLA